MNFSDKLIDWYVKNNRNLPWRKTKNPYYIWLSEIILQQTRVNQGFNYYLKFIEQFPTVFDLATASESAVLKLWQGLGYYSRARNLHATAIYITDELNGVFPTNYKLLKQLKGVGDYTASAIASICYNQPEAVVDGNVYRFLSRYFGVKTDINSTAGKKEFKALAQYLIDTKQPGTFNQAIMDFGALQCKPQKPLCATCLFNKSCVALAKKQVEKLPVKIKKNTIKKRYFNYLVLLSKNNKTAICQRTAKGIWHKLYEFPLVETTESINQKTLVKTDAYQQIVTQPATVMLYNQKPVVHKLSHQHIYAKFWIVKTEQAQLSTDWESVKKYPTPVLIANFLNEFNPLNGYF